MRKLTVSAAAFSLVAVSSSAFAADMPAFPESAIAVSHDWTGFYAGAHIGYGWGEGDTYISNTARTDVYPIVVDADGFLAGAQVGFNFQAGMFVLGAEADIAGSDIGGTANRSTFWGAANTTDFDFELKWLSTVRARIGMAFGDFFAYGTGGVAFGKLETSFEVLEAGRPFGSFSGTRTGYAAGGGFEYAMSDNTSVKVEYLYVDLGEEEYVPAGGFLGSAFDVQTIRAGVNYRF